jgi:hypothetical protein
MNSNQSTIVLVHGGTDASVRHKVLEELQAHRSASRPAIDSPIMLVAHSYAGQSSLAPARAWRTWERSPSAARPTHSRSSRGGLGRAAGTPL